MSLSEQELSALASILQNLNPEDKKQLLQGAKSSETPRIETGGKRVVEFSITYNLTIQSRAFAESTVTDGQVLGYIRTYIQQKLSDALKEDENLEIRFLEETGNTCSSQDTRGSGQKNSTPPLPPPIPAGPKINVINPLPGQGV